jgi:hypothetical protein
MRNMKHETEKTPSFYVVQIFGVSCIGREYMEARVGGWVGTRSYATHALLSLSLFYDTTLQYRQLLNYG